MPILEILWWISAVILMTYYIFLFRPKRHNSNYGNFPLLREAEGMLPPPGVSIIIAIRNGADVLIENLPYLTAQAYPLYEIIIIDDHSDVPEREKLEQAAALWPGVTLMQSRQPPGKKHALLLGIEMAKHSYILCTDADCRPASKDWIGTMMEHSRGEDMVLGYSPYMKSPGVLNRFVRFETMMTGIQYLSWALLGKPYMGVGRNMLYAKVLFQKTDPYASHGHIPYGDDDLWVQQARVHTPARACLDRDAFVYTTAPSSWRVWFRQKHRHLSAARHYTPGAWWKPGLFGMTLVAHWALLAVLMVTGQSNFIMGIGFVIGLVRRWGIYEVWNSRLDDDETDKWYPLLEPAYALYLAGMGFVTLIYKKKTWS